MKKIIPIIIVLFAISINAHTQDLIIKKNGDELTVKVIKITETEIEYRRSDQGDSGPVYSIKKAEVLLIKYANGTKDVFNSSASSPTSPPPAPAPPLEESGNTVIESNPNQESLKFSILTNYGMYGVFGLDARLSYKKWGFYTSLRGNKAYFGNNGPHYRLQYANYMVDNNNFYVNDYSWTGNSDYRRGSFMFGTQYRLKKWNRQDGLHLFVGMGSGMANYIYEYDISNLNTNQWVIDETTSKEGLDIEFGLFINSGFGAISIGYCILPGGMDYGYASLGGGIAFGSK
jgi:hypothetical protein